MNATVFSTRTVLQDRTLLTGAALVLVVLAVVGWVLFAGGEQGGARSGPHFSLLRCSACGEEVPFSPALQGKMCVSCQHGEYQPVPEGRSGALLNGKLILFLLLTAILLQGLAFLSVWRYRVLREAAAKERNRKLICRCPYCRRRLAYPPALIGTGAVCVQCKTAFTLPEAAHAELEEIA